MNSSGYYGRNGGDSRTSLPGSRQGGPGRPDSGAPGKRESVTREESRGYGRRPLRQRTPQHYPAHTRTHEQELWHGHSQAAVLAQDEIRTAFRYLQTHPQRALDTAEALWDSYSTQQPSLFIQVVLLKARALFNLNKIDDCIAFIDSLSTSMRSERSLLLAKGRALQAKGCFNQALPLFQYLYAHHSTTEKDYKTYSLGLGRLLQRMGGSENQDKALAIYTRLRTQAAAGKTNTPCNDKEIELTLGRHLQLMGGTDNQHKALAIFTRLRTWHAGGWINTPCNDKDIELALGRCLQLLGGPDNLEKALVIFTRLRTQTAGGRANTPCNDKEIELALGRHLQIMDGPDNLQQALVIFTRLRIRHAGGRINTPCNDKDIELALGRHLQLMGGADNLKKAGAIFTQLRSWHAAGRANTPCNEKDIELALGRHFQLMGGVKNLEQALAIFTRLRARAVGGQENTPCDDKDVELALGTVFEKMGGPANLEKALAILTRLRTRAAGGQPDTLGNDKDIELTLATLYIAEGNWPAFDALQFEAHGFPGFERHLCLSIRYWRELLETENCSPAHSRLLGKAIQSAVLAMEKSGFMNASCISQLAHCIRLLSYWPDVLLNERGMQRKDVKSLNPAAKFLFDTADMIAPCRQRMEKDQHWRTKERALLALLS